MQNQDIFTAQERQAVIDKLENDLTSGGSLSDEQIKLLVKLKAV